MKEIYEDRNNKGEELKSGLEGVSGLSCLRIVKLVLLLFPGSYCSLRQSTEISSRNLTLLSNAPGAEVSTVTGHMFLQCGPEV